MNLSFPWTDATSATCQLPDLQLVDGALGLAPDAPELSDPSDGTLVFEDNMDTANDPEHPDEHQNENLISILLRENEALRRSLDHSKELLALFNRNKAELKASRKRLVTVEADRAHLRSKIQALKAVIDELERDQPPRKRPRSTQSEPDPSRLSATDACRGDFKPPNCANCTARKAAPQTRPPATSEVTERPTLGAESLRNWLNAVVREEGEDVAVEHWNDSEFMALLTLQRSPSDVSLSASDAAAVFYQQLLDQKDQNPAKKTFQVLAQLSRLNHSESGADDTDMSRIVWELAKTGLASCPVSELEAAQHVCILFHGAFTGAWNLRDPLISTATFLWQEVGFNGRVSRGVLLSCREQLKKALIMSQNDPTCRILAPSLHAVIAKSIDTDSSEATVMSSGSQDAKGGDYGSIVSAFSSRCRYIIDTCLEPNGGALSEPGCLALSLECMLRPASECHDLVLNNLLWPTIRMTLPNSDRFKVLLQLVGCVGSRLAKETSPVMSKALDTLLGRLTSMLFVTPLVPQMRAAAVDAIISIVHPGDERFQNALRSLDKWRIQEFAVEDLKLLSALASVFLRNRKKAREW